MLATLSFQGKDLWSHPASASLQTASCHYVHKRYGELGAAMTANVITYQASPERAKSGIDIRRVT
jgi:hypothetical protein